MWQSVAFNIIIYIAGLQTVPREIYEAAAIDGAGSWRQFRSITFPMIAGFFTINMVLSLKGFLQVFDHIVALTNGGPGTATESVALLIYKGGFQGGEYGYQIANSVIFLIVIVAFSIVQLRFLQRRERVRLMSLSASARTATDTPPPPRRPGPRRSKRSERDEESGPRQLVAHRRCSSSSHSAS